MPPPIKVRLEPHNPHWATVAHEEALRLISAVGAALANVHHIGSTAIPGIFSKPIIDLMPVATHLEKLDDKKDVFEALGYVWWGELGLPGRRYCTKDDMKTGERLFQLHCYTEASPEAVRHLAFVEYLKLNPEIALQYGMEKTRCQALYPDDTHAYGDCKSKWIEKIEAEALANCKNGF